MKIKSAALFILTCLCAAVIMLPSLFDIFRPLFIGNYFAEYFVQYLRYFINTLLTNAHMLLLAVCAVLGFFLDRRKRPFKILAFILAFFMLSSAYSQIHMMYFGIPKYLEGKFLLQAGCIHTALYYLAITVTAVFQLFTPRFKKTKLIIFFAVLLINTVLALLIIFFYKTGLYETITLFSQSFLLFPAFCTDISFRPQQQDAEAPESAEEP